MQRRIANKSLKLFLQSPCWMCVKSFRKKSRILLPSPARSTALHVNVPQMMLQSLPLSLSVCVFSLNLSLSPFTATFPSLRNSTVQMKRETGSACGWRASRRGSRFSLNRCKKRKYKGCVCKRPQNKILHGRKIDQHNYTRQQRRTQKSS